MGHWVPGTRHPILHVCVRSRRQSCGAVRHQKRRESPPSIPREKQTHRGATTGEAPAIQSDGRPGLDLRGLTGDRRWLRYFRMTGSRLNATLMRGAFPAYVPTAWNSQPGNMTHSPADGMKEMFLPASCSSGME